MTSYVNLYIDPDDKIEAHLNEGVVRLISGGRSYAVIAPAGDDEAIVEACSKVISAFMDLRGRSIQRLALAEAARLQEAVPEANEPPLCPCGRGYVGHDARPITANDPRRHIAVMWDQTPKEAGHGESDRQGGEGAHR